MYAIFDNILATVVGGAVILTIAIISFRGQEAAIDSTQYVTAKSAAIDFGRRIEQDLNNVGSGLSGPDVVAGKAFESTDFAGTGTFSFRISRMARASSEGSGVTGMPDDMNYLFIGPPGQTQLVCYEQEMTGTFVDVYAGGGQYENVELFSIVRKVADAGAANCDGGFETDRTAPTVTQFSVLLREAPGVPAATAADVREVEIRMRMVSPLGGGTTEAGGGMEQHIDQTRWMRTFRPANLGRTL